MSLGVGMLYLLVSKKMKNWNCDKIKATDRWLWLSWVPYNIVTSDRDGSSHISLQGTRFRNFLTRKENYPKPVMDFPFFFSAEDVMSSLRKPCNFRSSQKKSTQKQEEWVGEELGQIDPGRFGESAEKQSEVPLGPPGPSAPPCRAFLRPPWKSHSQLLLGLLTQAHRNDGISCHIQVISRGRLLSHPWTWASSRHRNRAFVFRELWLPSTESRLCEANPFLQHLLKGYLFQIKWPYFPGEVQISDNNKKAQIPPCIVRSSSLLKMTSISLEPLLGAPRVSQGTQGLWAVQEGRRPHFHPCQLLGAVPESPWTSRHVHSPTETLQPPAGLQRPAGRWTGSKG